jgi:hypothetical protein
MCLDYKTKQKKEEVNLLYSMYWTTNPLFCRGACFNFESNRCLRLLSHLSLKISLVDRALRGIAGCWDRCHWQPTFLLRIRIRSHSIIALCSFASRSHPVSRLVPFHRKLS